MSETNGSTVSTTDTSKMTDSSDTGATSRSAIESKSADNAESGNPSAEEIATTSSTQMSVSPAGNSTEATNSGSKGTEGTKEEVESTNALETPESEDASQLTSANEEKCEQSARNDGTYTSRLEAEVQERTKERDIYRKKLEEAEVKLAALQASCGAITNHEGGNENTLQQSVEQLRGQLAQTALMYEERNRVVANQENQINALNNQVTSLKEVVAITRDLLEIRNVEVKQLQSEVDSMAKKITEERDRHNTMISKMDAAMRLNADLKKEYETQLALFQNLREKYGEKISLLTREKQAIEGTAITAPE